MTTAELARVLRAGAESARRYRYNVDLRLQAEILDHMADEAERITEEKGE
jgi:hypothetical protein